MSDQRRLHLGAFMRPVTIHTGAWRYPGAVPDANFNLALVDTPATIADGMEQWLHERGSDGFNVMFSWQPGGVDDFCGKVVPELRRRGLFRTDYEGTTLRDHLGLARPANRFFPAPARAAA